MVTNLSPNLVSYNYMVTYLVFTKFVTKTGELYGDIYSVHQICHQMDVTWMEKSADDLEFSAEELSGNAKTIKFALLEEPVQ